MKLSDATLIEAVRRIHACQWSERADRRILDVLADVFSFDYLMLALRSTRQGKEHAIGSCCGGDAPEAFARATVRRLYPKERKREDILSFLFREGYTVRVDPLDPKDPLRSKLHAATRKRFDTIDPIYFIPLKGMAGHVSAVIHASKSRQLDSGLSKEFERALVLLSENAGIAIENWLMRRQLDEVMRQRNVIQEISNSVENALSADHMLFAVVAAISSPQGLGFDRALLFLRDLEGRFNGAWGVAPENRAEWRALASRAGNIPLSALLETFEGESAPLPRPVPQVRKLTLTLGGGQARRCIESRQVLLCTGRTVVDPALEGFFSPVNATVYALVPLLATGRCIGLLYVDNAFNVETEVSVQSIPVLSILGERLGSVLQAIRSKDQSLRIEKSFVELMKAVASSLSGGESSTEALYEALFHATYLLGAERVCLVSRDANSKPWRTERKWRWDDDDGFWREALQRVTPAEIREAEATGISYVADPKGPFSGREAILAALPTGTSKKRRILCVEPWESLGIGPSFRFSVHNFSRFFAAVLSAAEQQMAVLSAVEGFVARPAETFASNLAMLTSHESRNVLNDLHAVVSTLYRSSAASRLSRNSKTKLSELLTRIELGIDQLQSYLQLLDRIEERPPQAGHQTNIANVAYLTKKLLVPRITRRGHPSDVIVVNVPEELYASVSHTNLTIVIHNLLSNAIKAVRETGHPVIEVGACPLAQSRVRIAVVDNGCGIKADERHLVFSRGYSGFAKREARALTHAASPWKSVGIGLSGTKRLVEDTYGGTVNVNTYAGRTTAVVILPGGEA